MTDKIEQIVSILIFLGVYSALVFVAASLGFNLGLDQTYLLVLLPPLGAIWLRYSKHRAIRPKGREWISLKFSAATAVVATICLVAPLNVMRLFQ